MTSENFDKFMDAKDVYDEFAKAREQVISETATTRPQTLKIGKVRLDQNKLFWLLPLQATYVPLGSSTINLAFDEEAAQAIADYISAALPEILEKVDKGLKKELRKAAKEAKQELKDDYQQEYLYAGARGASSEAGGGDCVE